VTIFLGPFLDTFVEIGATLALWRAARRSSSSSADRSIHKQ